MKGKSTTLSLIARFLKGSELLVVINVILSVITLGATLFPPLFQQIYTDNIITRKNPEWFGPLMIVYFLLFLIELAAWLTLNYERRRQLPKAIISASSKFIWTVLRLPMAVLDHFSSGELVARYKGIRKSAETIDSSVQSLAMLLQIVLTSWLLLLYNWQLGVVEIVVVILMVVVMRVSSKYQKNKARQMEKSDGRLQSVTMAGINNIETIKSAGAEQDFYAKWEAAYADSLNKRIASNQLMVWIGIIPLLVMQLCNGLVLCLGGWYILQGDLTPGMLLASQGLMGNAIFPLSKIVSSAQNIYCTHSALERVEEIDDYEDVLPEMTLSAELPADEKAKLRGEIELRDITFGYDRSKPPILKHFNLKIEPGQQVAFVGFSGCGKSTIAKLISGLYEPWEGEILFDGKPRKEIDRMVFNNSVSVVNQDITLFEGTLADNIKMWDESIEDFAMIMASYNAQIHDTIAERPDAYQAQVSFNGNNFSGGQRQRIEIAAALAKEPSILILDEATSALDPKTEEKVMMAIKALGLTLVMVAHRFATIRDCDQICVMEYGEIKQRGTHEELAAIPDGLYAKLNQYA